MSISRRLSLILSYKMGKNLAVFDFDHTISEENTDVAIINLLQKPLIPESIKHLYRSDGWTAYMQEIFKLCCKFKIDKNKITETIKAIPPVIGVDNLIKKLKEELFYDVIIISDSNSYFIDAWLKEKGLADYILKTFTNPARFSDDQLSIDMYHFQDYCKLSTKNLCKGQILDDFIKEQELEGIIYDKVVYVGDGTNDFCPILRLREVDLAFIREKYKCAEVVRSTIAGKKLDETGKPYGIRSMVVFWNNGDDILKVLKNPS